MYLKFKLFFPIFSLSVCELMDILEINGEDASHIVRKIDENGYYNIGSVNHTQLRKIMKSENFNVARQPTTSDQDNKQETVMKIEFNGEKSKSLVSIKFCCSPISRHYEEGYINIDKRRKVLYVDLEGHRYGMALLYCPYCGSKIEVNDISEI